MRNYFSLKIKFAFLGILLLQSCEKEIINIHTSVITDFRLTQLQNDNLYYNAQGILVKFNEGRWSWPMPSYNTDSTLILGYFYPGSTKPFYSYKYNSTGLMIEASIEDTDWHPTGVRYSFTYSNGKLISARFFRLLLPSGENCEYPPGNGDPGSPDCIWLLHSTIDYVMDNDSNIIEEIHKTPEGEIHHRVIHEYDTGINIFTHITPPLFLYWSDEVSRFFSNNNVTKTTKIFDGNRSYINGEWLDYYPETLGEWKYEYNEIGLTLEYRNITYFNSYYFEYELKAN